MDLPRLDRRSERPLVDQLAEHYRTAVVEGRLRPGDRLPTIRAMASGAGVTRSTVQDAYRRLAAAGVVESTVGRGTVVRGTGEVRSDGLSPGARGAWAHLLASPPARSPEGPVVANFAELNPDDALFPVAGFERSLRRVLADQGASLLGYGDPTGNAELRRVLAARPPEGAGDAEDVLVTSGAQQGIDLVLRTFTRPGDGVAVALPTYHHLFGLLEAHDLRVVPLPAGRLDPDEVARVLRGGEVRLLYLMPTFHNPTGRTMDLAEREALVQLLAETEVPVLEDEFELDLRFSGEDLPTLRSLDPRGRTVTVRTFSKGLFPGVRVGWVHASPAVLGPMAALKRYIDLETSPLLQAALLDFLATGAVDDHLGKLRDELRRRHAAAQEALAAHLPAGFTWTRPDGGFALWVEGPPGFDSDRLARDAAARGVLVAPGHLFHLGDAPVQGLRLSVSRADQGQLRRGIRILGECASALLAAAVRPSRRPLIL